VGCTAIGAAHPCSAQGISGVELCSGAGIVPRKSWRHISMQPAEVLFVKFVMLALTHQHFRNEGADGDGFDKQAADPAAPSPSPGPN